MRLDIAAPARRAPSVEVYVSHSGVCRARQHGVATPRWVCYTVSIKRKEVDMPIVLIFILIFALIMLEKSR